MSKKQTEILEIEELSTDATANIVFDTIKRGKQALVFVNSKPRAERTAEDLASKIKIKDRLLDEISGQILQALPKPTKQCEKLSRCITKGIAFHHAGLVAKQRELIEDNFRSGLIKIICCTPTLAAGVDLPAFRTIIKDVRRFGRFGMTWIPVLEYLQMSGRAGRPKFDTYGESILIAETKPDKRGFYEKYVTGEPEEIYSKLAVEPVLRTYVLSLIASEIVDNRKDLLSFFSKTFWALQYKDMAKLTQIIDKMLQLLSNFQFISMKKEDFVSADELMGDTERITATTLGKRVAELYIDPLTAHHLADCLKAATKDAPAFSFLQMVSHTLEMHPYLRVKTREYDDIEKELARYSDSLLEIEPSLYDLEYEDFLSSIKTALMLLDWASERDDEYLMEHYDIRPGEIRVKLDKADWLLYGSQELASLLRLTPIISEIIKLRLRLKYGVREELLPLLKLQNIGRVRSRKLYNNGIKNIADVKNADIMTLSQHIGKTIAIDIKKQVGQEFAPDKIKIKEGKRKGQISLHDFSDE